MSHEIRTPLNAVIGFADLLRRGADSDKAERMEWLDTIHSSGKHLLALINDILDLSKVDAGKLTVETVACSPGEIIDEVCAILRSKAEEKGLRLEVAFDGPMPRTIHSDPTRFRQVLMNVAGNAIKFTPTGYVRVRAGSTGRRPNRRNSWSKSPTRGSAFRPTSWKRSSTPSRRLTRRSPGNSEGRGWDWRSAGVWPNNSAGESPSKAKWAAERPLFAGSASARWTTCP